MKKIVLIILLIAFMALSDSAEAKAERPIVGFSELLEDVTDADFYSAEDLNLLAEVMYWENYSNGEYIMLLTGSVVLNRVAHEWFPDTIESVLYQKGQYATVGKFYTKTIPDSVYSLAKQLLVFGSIAPAGVIYQSMYERLGSSIYYTERGEYFAYE